MSGTVFKEIEAATHQVIEAFNNGTLDPAEYYTEDCQLIRPGRQTVSGHRGILQLIDSDAQQLTVCDEIGPEDATNLAYSRGSFVLYTKKEEVICSGRYVAIWKKTNGKWLIHRDIPLVDSHFKEGKFQDLIEAEKQIVDAYNSEAFDPAKYYTNDSVLMSVGKDVVKSLEGIKAVWDRNRCDGVQKEVTAIETISSDSGSSLAFTKGYFILYKGGKLDRSGRYSSIWKKVDGKWLLHRDIPDVDQDRLVQPLQNDHKEIRATEKTILAAYNSSELEPSRFYTGDCLLIPPRGDVISGHDGLRKVLQKSKDEARQVIAVPHEIIANDKDNLAYEMGHFVHYITNGDIRSAGVYITIWKKEKSEWLIYRDIPHVYYTEDQSEPAVFKEIRDTCEKIVEAYNSGTFNVAEFYTEDCIVAIPGREPLKGHGAIEAVYKRNSGASRYQVQVIDEVGPRTATNLCYVKGHYIDCNTSGEMADSGSFDVILKKINGKWMSCRDMPKIN